MADHLGRVREAARRMTENQRERDAAIVAAVRNGEPQADVARAADITRQRVGQIVADAAASPAYSPPVASVRSRESPASGFWDEELKEIRAISDPMERARRATEFIDRQTDRIAALSAVRQEALELLRHTMTQAEIAKGTGLTRARVSQLLGSAPRWRSLSSTGR